MAQTKALDRVIKMVDSNYQTSYGGERIVLVDYKKGKVLKRKPFFSFWKEFRYYSVSLNRSIECEGLICNIRDIATKHSLNIKIDYEVSCLNKKDEQDKLVLAIYKRDNPKIAIEEYIEQWVKSFNKEKRRANINIISSFLEEKEELKNYIIDKAESILGLEIHPFISLDGDVETRKETSPIFPIRVSDYDYDISVKYEVGLEIPDDQARVKAILNNTNFSKLLKIIRNEVEKFMMKECTLHQLCYNFNGGKKPQIIDILNEKLKKYGRQISFMKFDLYVEDLMQTEAPLITHISECKIKESPTLINVENRVLLNLVNLGRFKRSGVTVLEKWLQKKLDKICQEVFFERNRIDLISSLEDDKKSIQRKLESESSRIGYEIKHLASLPDLDELSLKKGVKVTNEDLRDISKDGDAVGEELSEYRTSDSQTRIKLDFVINGRIEDFTSIEDYLKDGVSVFKQRVARKAKDIIEEEVRERHPADIYKSAFDGENSIDKILKVKIKESLEKEFGFVDTRISILFLDNDLSIRLRKLLAAFPFFVFGILPSKKPVRLPYRISYQIGGVDKDKYHTFQSKKFGTIEEMIEQINNSLRDAVMKRMKDLPGEILFRSSISDLLKLENNVKEVMQTVAKNVFGLLLDSILIRRLDTKEEKELLRRNYKMLSLGVASDIETAKKSMEMNIENIKLLYEQEKNFLRNNDEEEAKEIRRQIKELEEKSGDYMDSYHQLEKEIGPANDEENHEKTTLGSYLLESSTTSVEDQNDEPKKKNEKDEQQ